MSGVVLVSFLMDREYRRDSLGSWILCGDLLLRLRGGWRIVTRAMGCGCRMSRFLAPVGTMLYRMVLCPGQLARVRVLLRRGSFRGRGILWLGYRDTG